jgi:hypothetical protein
MIIYVLLQRGSSSRPIDSMRGLPPIVGWIAIFAIAYIVLRVGLAIKKEREGKRN